MKITLSDIGKKYNQEWIFRGIHFSFKAPGAYAVLGNNGSGKSTLLQVISGRVVPAAGSVHYTLNNKQLKVEEMFRHYAIAAPYQELIEEFTLPEMLEFHQVLKPFYPGIRVVDIIKKIGFPNLEHKQMRYYSSGMKQRVKLALAILSDVPLVLLDEPCSNLDKQGMEWYNQMVAEYSQGRLFIVCSNHQPEEIGFCGERLNVNEYKTG